MFKISLIAATLTATIAAAAPREETAAAPSDPVISAPQDQIQPAPERRRHRERRRYQGYQGYQGADSVSGYAARRRAIDVYSGAEVGEWNYGQPPHEAPAPSPRGLHNGLWYY